MTACMTSSQVFLDPGRVRLFHSIDNAGLSAPAGRATMPGARDWPRHLGAGFKQALCVPRPPLFFKDVHYERGATIAAQTFAVLTKASVSAAIATCRHFGCAGGQDCEQSGGQPDKFDSLDNFVCADEKRCRDC